jgi:hypothetical protein
MFRTHTRCRLPRLAGILTLFSAVGAAQVSDSARQTELIEKLLQRIDQLEKRVSELETTRPSAPPALQTLASAAQVSPTPLASVIPPALPPPAMDMGREPGAPVDAAETGPSMKITGYADFDYSASDQKGTHSAFSEGQFILHISSALSRHVSYFGELSLTARTDAGTGTPPTAGFNPEVERSIIRYDQSDHLKISFGRFHTPVGYWNTEFHHGTWLQTTISRPEMIQFGGSFIPVHFVGTLAEGSFSAGGLNLNYNAGVGNGRSYTLSRSGDFGDVNNNKAWTTTVYIKPAWLYGLQAGASLYRDKIDATGRPQAQEWISSAYLVWYKERPEFISEFFNVNHRLTATGISTNDQAWYAQFAYRLPYAERFKPYYRYEYIHITQADKVFEGLDLGLNGSTLGVRYDISSFSALKLEWRNQNRPGVPNINLLWAQTSFTF